MKNNIFNVDTFPNGKNNLTSRAGYIQRLNYDFVFQKLQNNFNVDFFDLKNEFLYI